MKFPNVTLYLSMAELLPEGARHWRDARIISMKCEAYGAVDFDFRHIRYVSSRFLKLLHKAMKRYAPHTVMHMTNINWTKLDKPLSYEGE